MMIFNKTEKWSEDLKLNIENSIGVLKKNLNYFCSFKMGVENIINNLQKNNDIKIF